jgi:hypothetical protein
MVEGFSLAFYKQMAEDVMSSPAAMMEKNDVAKKFSLRKISFF